MTPEQAERRREQRLRAEENVKRIARGEEPLPSLGAPAQKPPIRPGLYRNEAGARVRVIENANPEIGPWQVLGNIWIGASESEFGNRAVLVTTEFLQEVYEREEDR